MSNYKQVLVVRQKYPDANGELKKTRKGKELSQAAHASVAATLVEKFLLDSSFAKTADLEKAAYMAVPLTEPLKAWLWGLFKKIAIGVDTEEELLDLKRQADEAGLVNVLIEDSGLTEFHGVKTKTVLAIGPDTSEKIDKITGHLKLL